MMMMMTYNIKKKKDAHKSPRQNPPLNSKHTHTHTTIRTYVHQHRQKVEHGQLKILNLKTLPRFDQRPQTTLPTTTPADPQIFCHRTVGLRRSSPAIIRLTGNAISYVNTL